MSADVPVDKQGPRLEFEIDGYKYSFETSAQAGTFLSNARSNIDWALTRPVGSVGYNEFRSSVGDGISELIASTSNPAINNAWLSSQISQFFSKYRLPVASTPYSEFINEVRDKYGDNVALGVLASRSDIALDFSRPAFAKGVSLSIMYEEGISSTSIKSSQIAVSNEYERFRLIADEAEKMRLRNNEVFHEQLEYNRKYILNSAARLLNSVKRIYRKRNIKQNIALVNLENTRKAYSEQMRLKAPVEYWMDKAQKHRTQAQMYRMTLIEWGWKIGSGVILLLVLIAAITHYWASASAPIGSYIGPATIGIIVTTIAFWAARIVVRLYMSEHHLAIDAEERAIMVQTYLALIENGAATETERALVLAPLFKSSSDGIVKDDAAPDLSPASLLSKALSKP